MDIINSSSLDVPYEDTNYSCEIIIMAKTPGKQGSTIQCSKVMTKKYKDMTYFKVEIPAGVSINSEEEIQINIQRDDNHRLTIQTKIRNNIVAIETVNIKWVMWTIQGIGTQTEWLENMRRIMPTNPQINMNPVWDTRGVTSIGSANPQTMMFRTSVASDVVNANGDSFIGYASGGSGSINYIDGRSQMSISSTSAAADLATHLEAMHRASAVEMLAELEDDPEDDI